MNNTNPLDHSITLKSIAQVGRNAPGVDVRATAEGLYLSHTRKRKALPTPCPLCELVGAHAGPCHGKTPPSLARRADHLLNEAVPPEWTIFVGPDPARMPGYDAYAPPGYNATLTYSDEDAGTAVERSFNGTLLAHHYRMVKRWVAALAGSEPGDTPKPWEDEDAINNTPSELGLTDDAVGHIPAEMPWDTDQ